MVLKKNNLIIDNKVDIAELFNKHFVELVSGLQPVSETIYGKDFARHPSIKSVYKLNSHIHRHFSFISQTQVQQLILDVNVRTSCGNDMMLPRLVKQSASVIAKPITSILNC